MCLSGNSLFHLPGGPSWRWPDPCPSSPLPLPSTWYSPIWGLGLWTVQKALFGNHMRTHTFTFTYTYTCTYTRKYIKKCEFVTFVFIMFLYFRRFFDINILIFGWRASILSYKFLQTNHFIAVFVVHVFSTCIHLSMHRYMQEDMQGIHRPHKENPQQMCKIHTPRLRRWGGRFAPPVDVVHFFEIFLERSVDSLQVFLHISVHMYMHC